MTELLAERGWLETASIVASLVLSITLLAITFFVAPAALQFWKTFKKAQAVLDRFDEDVGPLMRNARALADRLGELNALLAVAQEEAEGAFVATASAVRGVRTGTAALTDRGRDPDDELEDDEDGDDDESNEDADEREHRFPSRHERHGAERPTRPRLRSQRPERS